MVSAGHEDYPALVAEALDQLQAHGPDMPRAAEVLGMTPTQLLKLFKRDPAAWTLLNRLWVTAGPTTLKEQD